MALSRTLPRIRLPAPSLPQAVIAGGFINARVNAAVEQWQGGGLDGASGLFGVSPVELLIAVIALGALRSVDLSRVRGGLTATGLALALLLIPSSTCSWLVTLGYAVWLCAGNPPTRRSGPLLAAGLAVCALWQIFAERIAGGWLLTPDAVSTTFLLNALGEDATRFGNLVSRGNGYEIVILGGCSTLQPLPMVLLGAMAAAPLCGISWQLKPLLRHAAMVAAGFVLLNTIRLVLLGWSADVYEVVHGTIGRNIFDVLVILLMLPVLRATPAAR